MRSARSEEERFVAQGPEDVCVHANDCTWSLDISVLNTNSPRGEFRLHHHHLYCPRTKPVARLAVPAIVVVLLMARASVDHFFRDEFYYLACTRHIAWGYVDQPPLSIAILWIVRHLAGESLLALRLVSALALAVSIWLTGSIARRLGAGGFGELLAMVTMAIAPEFLAIGSFYSMNVFDVLLWTAAFRIFMDAGTTRTWAALGLVLGLGLLKQDQRAVAGRGNGRGDRPHAFAPAAADAWSVRGHLHRGRPVPPARPLAGRERLAHARIHPQREQRKDAIQDAARVFGRAGDEPAPDRARSVWGPGLLRSSSTRACAASAGSPSSTSSSPVS